MEDNKKKLDNSNRWSVSKIFWGLLFVLVGSLILAENFGWIDVNWGELWRLWPLLIISAGLSILSINKIVWKIFVIILAILSICLIGFVALTNPTNLKSHTREIQIDKTGVHIIVRD